MSIAVSVLLAPSQFLYRSLAAFAVVVFIAGGYIALFDVIPGVIRFSLLTLCWIASVRLFSCFRKLTNVFWQVDINMLGHVRCVSRCRAEISSGQISASIPSVSSVYSRYYEIRQATLWANGLFLRLHHADHGESITLLVLPDMLAGDEFRRLSIACRWIVAHAAAVRPNKMVTYGT